MKTILQKIRLGDKISVVTKVLGIPECAACRKRKSILNGETTQEQPKVMETGCAPCQAKAKARLEALKESRKKRKS